MNTRIYIVGYMGAGKTTAAKRIATRLGWDVGVTWHDGRLFECPGCVRIAVSVPHAQVIEAFDRLDRYVF